MSISRERKIGVLTGLALLSELSTAKDTSTAVFDALNEKWGIDAQEILLPELRDEIVMTLAEGLGVCRPGR